MASGIYVIHNTKNGKVYIGQAQDILWRWTTHKHKLNAGNHENHQLQAAWNEFGPKAFRFMVLEYCAVDKLNEREQHYLDLHMPTGNCYNIKKWVTRSDHYKPAKPKTIGINIRADEAYMLNLKYRAFDAGMRMPDYLRMMIDKGRKLREAQS